MRMDQQKAISGACQARPEPVAMARIRDLSVFRMHAASAAPAALQCLAKNAPVAQLDRAPDYESGGQEFESLRARHFGTELGTLKPTVLRFKRQRACAAVRFSSHDAKFLRVDFDAL